jgi:hypothetical protein
MWDGYERFEGSGPLDGPFNRSAAINEAAHAAGDWQVAIIADCDSWVPRTQVEQAIVMAQHTGRLVIAHDGIWQSRDRDWNIIEQVRGSQSGVLAIRRDLWDTVAGFDERFIGWGHEDRAFHHACLIAGGKPLRVPGPITHLEHGAKATSLALRGDAQFEANRALARRYLDCPDVAALAGLIAERATVDTGASVA